MPFVNDAAIPNANHEYVCWLDMMGTKSKMGNSVKTCAIFIFRLHTAVLEAIEKGCAIETYPVMDGVYITSKTRADMESALFSIFCSLGETFSAERNNNHRFLVKACVAFGPIIHGKDVEASVTAQFSAAEAYKNSLLLGLPMIQAYAGEAGAPPFGVFVHESARAFCPQGEEPFVFKWWKWFLLGRPGWNKEKTDRLKAGVEDYFRYCQDNTNSLDYPLERVAAHQAAAREYFLDRQV